MYTEKYDWWVFIALFLLILNIFRQKHTTVFCNYVHHHKTHAVTPLNWAGMPGIPASGRLRQGDYASL